MPRTLIVIALTAAVAAAQTRPPNNRETNKLIATFLAADGATEAGHRERTAVLERLAVARPLTARKEAEWRKKIAKAQTRGRKLEPSGDNWFWPADQKQRTTARGRYIVGGERRKPKGLLIAMHGGGVGSGDARSAYGMAQAAASKLGWIVIAPEVLEKTAHGWTDSGTEEFVLGLVDAALRTFKVDPDRVYFSGHSMGGYGSWMLGGHHADRIAAIAPSAGAPTPILDRTTGRPIDIIEGVIPSLRNVFVSVYQSLDDPKVPPAPNQFAVQQLTAAAEQWGGFEHDYWEVDGRGHSPPPGGQLAQLQKIAPRARTPVPERIVWQPVLPWKRQFYWLYWDAPVANATVVADLDRTANRVVITCDVPTNGLYVLFDDRVLDLDREVIIEVGGAETFRGPVQRSLPTLLLTGWHPDGKLQFAARAPAFTGKKG